MTEKYRILYAEVVDAKVQSFTIQAEDGDLTKFESDMYAPGFNTIKRLLLAAKPDIDFEKIITNDHVYFISLSETTGYPEAIFDGWYCQTDEWNQKTYRAQRNKLRDKKIELTGEFLSAMNVVDAQIDKIAAVITKPNYADQLGWLEYKASKRAEDYIDEQAKYAKS